MDSEDAYFTRHSYHATITHTLHPLPDGDRSRVANGLLGKKTTTLESRTHFSFVRVILARRYPSGFGTYKVAIICWTWFKPKHKRWAISKESKFLSKSSLIWATVSWYDMRFSWSAYTYNALDSNFVDKTGCRGWNRTSGLRVMSLTRYYFSTLR